MQRLLHGAKEEIDILEITQKAQVDSQAEGEQKLTAEGRGFGFQAARDDIIDGRGNTDNPRQPLIPARVEEETSRQQEPHTAALPRNDPVEQKDGGEKGEKLLGAEEHRVGPSQARRTRFAAEGRESGKRVALPASPATRSVTELAIRSRPAGSWSDIGRWCRMARRQNNGGTENASDHNACLD